MKKKQRNVLKELLINLPNKIEKSLPKNKYRKKRIFNYSSSDTDPEEDDITDEFKNDNTDDDELEELYKIGDFVIVHYEGEYYPGIVNDTNQTSTLVSVMTMSGSG